MQGAVSSTVSSQPAQDADALDAPDAPEALSRDDRGDVALALALVRAARSVEQVVDVSAGRHGTAVTYGPGQRVTGIVLRRSATAATSAAPLLVVEAHILVATAAVTVLAAPPLPPPKTARQNFRHQSRAKRRRPGCGGAGGARPLAHRRRGAWRAWGYLRRLRQARHGRSTSPSTKLRDSDARALVRAVTPASGLALLVCARAPHGVS
jgi:hypothetical protein